MKKVLLFSALLVAGLTVNTVQMDAQNSNNGGKANTPLKASRVSVNGNRQLFKSVSSCPFTIDKDSKVLKQTTVAKGVTVNVVRDSKGRVFKFTGFGKTGKVSAPMRKGIRKTDFSDASFYESFEGWKLSDGMNWIPDGWKEINTKENTPTDEMLDNNVNNTWYCYYTGDNTWTPKTPDGEKECYIHYTYNGTAGETEFKAAPQDEWLITPSITVKEGDVLYFDAAIDLSGLMDLDWSTMSYPDRTTKVNDLEVEISTDDGTTWTKAWGCYDDVASKMTDKELIKAMNMKYYTFKVSIAQYVGKKIMIAFRYTNKGDGNSGNSMALDGVLVGSPAATAGYEMPVGTLLSGLSKDFYAMESAVALLPAYSEVQWRNASNVYADNVEWTFANQEVGKDNIISNDLNPVITYKSGQTLFPSVKASNTKGSETYAWGSADENAPYIQCGGNVNSGDRVFGLGNYDVKHCSINTPYFAESSYCFGTGSDDTWGAKLKGVANIFEQPTAPLYISDANVMLGAFDADKDAIFNMYVIGFDKYGYMADTIAVAKANGGDVIDNNGTYCLPFKFYSIDNDGKEIDAPFILNRAAMIMIDGFADNTKVRKFAAMAQAKNNESGTNYAYLKFELTGKNGKTYERYYAASDVLEDYSTALVINLNGVYNYLYADNNQVEVPSDGGSKEVDVDSYYQPSSWWIVNGDKQMYLDNPVVVDWLTITSNYDSNTGKMSLSFKADKSTKERTQTIVIDTYGASTTFIVSQKATTGIDINENNNIFGIQFNGNTLFINGAKEYTGSTVKLFNCAGQLLSSTIVKVNGEAVMNNLSLSKGIYLINLGNKSMKIVKR
jgi:hypothetical protein